MEERVLKPAENEEITSLSWYMHESTSFGSLFGISELGQVALVTLTFIRGGPMDKLPWFL